MTIGDPFIHNTTSSGVLTSNACGSSCQDHHHHQNLTHSLDNNNQHHNRDMTFHPNHHNASLQNNKGCKRRNSEDEHTLKKVKQLADGANAGQGNGAVPVDQLTLENIDLNSYPKYNHPEGGIIQFTPIGNIRTFLSDNNVLNRTIEKNSSFDISQTECGIDGYKLYLGNISMDSSPSNEIETYMRSGYNAPSSHPTSYYHNPGACACCTTSSATHFDYDCDSDLEDDDDYMS